MYRSKTSQNHSEEFTPPFHSYPIEEVYKELDSNEEGLSSKEAQRKEELFGKNQVLQKKTSLWKIFFRQFHNLLVYILIAASLISLFIGEYKDFFVILAIILLNGIIAFFQEVKAETSIDALKKLTQVKNKVLRDGNLKEIASQDLVLGDVVLFHEGEAVTADLRIIDAQGLMVDESSLSGESMPVLKDPSQIVQKEAPFFDHSNMLFAGTIITRGTGKALVVRAGAHTHFASIAKRTQEASPDTPLTRSLRKFVKAYVLFLGFLFPLLGIIGLIQKREPLELFYILLASLVSAVPEGLPIVLTLVMVVGALKLSKKNVLVRYLPSVETMGSVTVIASDKTGTITEAKLIVAEVFSKDEEKLKQVAALCNDARDGKGDPIDVALLNWAEKAKEIRKSFPRTWSFPFDARQRLMATKHEINGKEELLIKGAFESLAQLSQNVPKNIEEKYNLFLEKGLRTLAFGKASSFSEPPESWDVEIIGIIGFIDPPKQGVDHAVKVAQDAQIRVAMITGDHLLTAKQIAKEVGIYRETDLCLTGPEIEKEDETSLFEKVKKTTLFARIIPEDKYQIIKMLQKDKQIVAVTGDGVNDAPALKAADIGIAMGGGTEAAKSVSNMIITDNNLKVIVDAIENARVIADNIRKVIYYLMATSFQELIVITLSILFSLPIPLSATQILWINIVTDGVQDKFFAFAKQEGDVMKRGPRNPERLFFNHELILRVFLFAVPMGLLVFFIYLHLKDLYSFETVSTVIFTSVVFAQWANGIQAQKEKTPFFKNVLESFTINPLVYLGLFIGIILQVLAVTVFFDVFHAKPLSFDLWKIPVLVFVISFCLVELRKWGEVGIEKLKSFLK